MIAACGRCEDSPCMVFFFLFGPYRITGLPMKVQLLFAYKALIFLVNLRMMTMCATISRRHLATYFGYINISPRGVFHKSMIKRWIFFSIQLIFGRFVVITSLCKLVLCHIATNVQFPCMEYEIVTKL